MQHTSEPIAIVGSACRFPGSSTSPSKLWELLKQPRDVLSNIDRFKAKSFYHPNGHYHGASNVRQSYLLNDDPCAFDAQFFNIQAAEAESIDPQQRLLLESVYESLESAGLKVEDLQGSRTAVYVGVMCDDYAEIVYHDVESIPKYAATGSARSIMSNRISYFFDWHGPSMTIDTACSSSLVAVHQAVQTLRSGESHVAVAAGANLIFGPKMYIAESNLNMLSPTGRSRMWDADADGYARGEGIGTVVLKTLSAALADGDDIECIIRETGVNQDGRTTGITMPSATAQADLIAQTYARAGLDPRKETDRCQFFEAHGTGTKAGDPQEASAICEAFFGGAESPAGDVPLWVGSIKTVIGHTEGTAGIAGLLKASLAVRNKTIPPNMHFNRLNPDVAPYYSNLRIPTRLQPWPELPAGTPRRVSVNSFGFGGTNAHAIVESYELPAAAAASVLPLAAAGPFVFSAASVRSLKDVLAAHADFLRSGADVDLRTLAWALHHRRSAFPVRTSVAAQSVEELCERLDAQREEASFVRAATKSRRIVGVFTGQGAQWASMGRGLVLASAAAAQTLAALEESLTELPEGERPTWSLREQLLAPPETSRVSEAALSQPLCTAVQVLLVDLLHACGIAFDAVVGHSSGEIGAAYAAGFVSARDAIRIAYLRGLHATAARGGAMLAAGTSMDDASELCALPAFRGRLCVAASNSSASVTLSGDAAAIDRAQLVMEDEQKFARKLVVDTAYHSHHMLPCLPGYIEAMRRAGIELRSPPPNGPRWFSSVLDGREMHVADVDAVGYWADNMAQPVLFSQALAAAAAATGAPAVAIEVGPHPALRGPATLTLEETVKGGCPYTGTLRRGGSDVQALADCMGFVWSHLGPAAVDLERFDEAFSGPASHALPKNLPQYPWDHDRTFWSESRESRMLRLRDDPVHALLGTRCPSTGEGQHRWRNYLQPTELPWMRGHQIQGQLLFPAAGFACMALEACTALAAPEETRLIDITDFSIHRALGFSNDSAGVETLFCLSNVRREAGHVLADFSCDACLARDSGFTSVANGKLSITLGSPVPDFLPAKPAQLPEMGAVDVDAFYSSLHDTGYNYSGMFQTITTLERTRDAARGSIFVPRADDSESALLLHPAPLDVAFQAIFAALAFPGDGDLWTLRIPTLIERIRLNPSACMGTGCLEMPLTFEAEMGASSDLRGDVVVRDASRLHTVIQIESLHVSPLATPTAKDDRQLVAETVWGPLSLDLESIYQPWVLTDDESAASTLCERTCLFYLRRLHETIQPDERERCNWHQARLLEWAAHTVARTAADQHPTCKKEWLDDSYEYIQAEVQKMMDQFQDFQIVLLVGETLVPFVRGETTVLEQFRSNNLLDHFYRDSIGTPEYNAYLGQVAEQLAHRYPSMDFLEIGAGTGSATTAILKRIGHRYNSYTYTDISAAFFEDAQRLFADEGDRFTYKTLDIEQDCTDQGFPEHTYDAVVASNVLHATRSLENTLRNARRLLKPGGHLLMLEITNNRPLRIGFIFSGLPGWWVAEDDARRLTPQVSRREWDAVLRRTGFAGVDTTTPSSKNDLVPFSVMAAQAVDAHISLLREPLAHPAGVKPVIDNLVIVGGATFATSRLVQAIGNTVAPYCRNIAAFDCLEAVDNIPPKATVLNVTELETAFFNPFTVRKLESAKNIFDCARLVLWVTQGNRADDPYANMMYGVARCLASEMKRTLRMQMLDFDASVKPNAELIVSSLLRLQIADTAAQRAGSTLWSIEHELSVTSSGAIEVPRYRPSQGPNDRYNSTRRPISTEVSLDGSVVDAVCTDDDTVELREGRLPGADEAGAEYVDVRVLRSTASALQIGSMGFLFLIVGVNRASGQTLLALSPSCSSAVRVPKGWTVECDVAEDRAGQLLVAAASSILATAILAGLEQGASLLVHDSTPLLASLLEAQAAEKRTKLTLTMSREDGARYDLKELEPTPIHPWAPERAARQCVPQDISLLVDLAASEDPVRLSKFAPQGCRLMVASSLLSPHSSPRAAWPAEELAACLSQAHAQTQPELLSRDDRFADATEVPIGSLAGRHTTIKNATLEVIDWTATPSVAVSVQPAVLTVRFRPDRTYFLLGMTGDLGRSLCRWMVERGAQHFALASRRPNGDQPWVKMMRAAGVTVNMFAVDVTSKNSVLSAHREICRTMPPIAGVANAAMVLEDLLFSNMTYETMNKVLRPKVDGSRILDEVFATNDLDFFVLFSSLAAVTGNYGQSPYAAANAFMCALAHRRRKRGLVGSVMNLAGIKGLGYIHRTDETILDRLDTMGYATVSERDFLTFFAECVDAGRPDSGRTPELSAGLQSFDPTYAHAPAWIDNPKFAHYRQTERHAATAVDAAGRPKESVRTQLAEVASMEEAERVLQEAFLATLQQTLKLPADGSLTPDTPVISLGVDSLVAIDMRSWFANELDLDMPVLKILGGATVGELVEYAVERMSRELVPKAAPLEENGSTDSSEEGSGAEGAGSDADSDDDSSVLSEEIPARSERVAEEEECCGEDKEERQPLPAFEKTVAMSYASTRIWFLQQYLDDPTSFNLFFRARITGPLRVHDLQRAASVVAERHEAFRTAFFSGDDGAPMQGVLPASSLRLEIANAADDQQVADALRALASHRYDIERGQTARLVLLSQGPNLHHLLFGFHHIAIDGFSFNVFLSELDRAYRRQPLPPVALQFSDFATRQRRAVESGQLKAHLDFWKSEYADCPPPLPLFPLASCHTRKALTRYESAEASVTLNADLTARIRDQARRHRATSFHFFLATLKTFLFRWLDTDDLSVGLADANRTDSDTSGTIGFLLNLLPLRMRRWPGDSSFADVLAEARNKTYAALAHSPLPFGVLLEELAITRSSTTSPLFQVFFDYRQLAIHTEKALGAEMEGEAALGNTAYDVTLDITDYAGGEVTVAMKTQEYLYPKRAVELLLRSYVRMLEVFAARPDARESEPALFDDDAVHEALDAGRGPAMDLAWPSTVSQRIDVMAAQHPDRTAIRDGHGATLTYSTMDARCNAICAALDSHGIAEGAAVALLQEPTAGWACSVLGVWRAGCAYVPLDTRHTPQRIAAVLSDCRASAIICDARTATRAAKLCAPDMAVINVDMLDEDPTPRASRARPEEPAAILYTSGSTGVPKGIMLRHDGIRNNIEGTDRHWGVGRETVLQQSACTFDMSLRQLLTALTHGGTLYVASAEARRDPAQLCSLLVSENISWTVATPSEYQAWLAYGAKDIARATSWRFATSGGEAFTRSLRDEFAALRNPLLRVFNAYGPSEITFSCAEAEIPSTPDVVNSNDDGSISLGRPLPNYTIRIVDEHLRPLPAGVAGEIVVGGPSVAAGYVDTSLNAAKFITDPDDAAAKAYRTGDVGHLDRDGTLFFHGRVSDDSQVKLRGIRIELGDVESAIVKAADGTVAAAVASVRGNPPFLVAHVEFTPGSGDNDKFLAALKPRLAQALPQYMCPATLVAVDRLPLTAHGKLDRRAAAALPLAAAGTGPQQDPSASSSSPPAASLTADQRALERLWRAVVSHDAPAAVDANTSFFDVGGNSLLLVKLAQLIRDEMGAAVPLRQLLEDNTLGAMAAAVARGIPAASSVDWIREDTTAPEPLDLSSVINGPLVSPRRDPARLRVLLTGATGYLGRRILQQLVADDRVAEVHCLAVRNQAAVDPADYPSNKVIAHAGDLSAPRLGLSETTFAQLAASADAVVHSGANRSFWDPYEHLRGPNVASTRELVRLAAPRRVPLHFVSSAGALELLSSSSSDDEEGNKLPDVAGNTSGYVLSKWASERLLADAADRLGLPVRVHRAMPAAAAVEEADGAPPPEELLNELRDVAVQLHALPSATFSEDVDEEAAGAWNGHFDLIRVDALARELCEAAVADDDDDTGVVAQYRYPSTVRLSMQDVAEFVESVEEKKKEEPWVRLPPHAWAGQAKRLGFGWHFAVMDASIAATSGGGGEGLALRR